MSGVSLSKGAKVSLTKEAGASKIGTLSFGLGWTGQRGGLFGIGPAKSVDLDASCVVVRNGAIEDAIWFGQLSGARNRIRHSGDDRTGLSAPKSDNEIITVDADKLPIGTILVFTVNSYSGQRFSTLASAYIRITDDKTGRELARFNLRDFGNHTGLIVGALLVKEGDYEFQAIEQVVEGRTVRDLFTPIRRLVNEGHA